MADLILEHYSSTPVTAVLSRVQTRLSHKPEGLWVSVKGEDNWPSWCESENFGDPSRQVRHTVTLALDARILFLSNVIDIDAFHRDYAEQAYAGQRGGYPNWKRLAETHQGIIIAPYQWKRRLEGPASDWYHGWDCASGCIWDAEAIASIEVAEARELAEAQP